MPTIAMTAVAPTMASPVIEPWIMESLDIDCSSAQVVQAGDKPNEAGPDNHLECSGCVIHLELWETGVELETKIVMIHAMSKISINPVTCCRVVNLTNEMDEAVGIRVS